MSGGFFDYKQHFIQDIIFEIKKLIENNNTPNEFGEINRYYTQRTIDEFKNAVEILEKAEYYIHRIDWLVSGDDGENTFHEKLK